MNSRYPDPNRVSRERRPQRTQCPTCRQGVRVGWSAGRRVVGQHWAPAQLLTASSEAPCCPCPGSWTPVADGDSWDYLQTAALTATGTLRAVPALPPVPAPLTRAPQPPADPTPAGQAQQDEAS